MYECIVGYPPFFSEDPLATCRKIVNWRKTLEFPDDVELSPESVDLIKKWVRLCSCAWLDPGWFAMPPIDWITKESSVILSSRLLSGKSWDIRNLQSSLLLSTSWIPRTLTHLKKIQTLRQQRKWRFRNQVSSLQSASLTCVDAKDFEGFTFVRPDVKHASLGSIFGGS